MSSTPTVTASYSAASATETTTTELTTAPEALSFQVPIHVSSDTTVSSQTKKEQYLTALAQALVNLQESINTGLTERLVQKGVLSENTEQEAATKNKLRTKVPGQPNNSKKGQTKAQQLREREIQKQQQQQQQEKQDTQPSSSALEAAAAATTDTNEGAQTTIPSTTQISEPVSTFAAMDIDPSSSTQNVELDELKYRPKGGIYEDDEDDEINKDKDEVDLLMEADPGEVDGACLELPKEEQQQQQTNKKRNGLPSDDVASVSATTKKSRGSEDA